jgi:serine/threonine protein kinase
MVSSATRFLICHLSGEITDGDSVENTSEMYRKILNDPLEFPDEMGKDARNLIIRLLSRDLENRLGSNGAKEIKKHPFFKGSMSAFLSLRFNGLIVFHSLS